MHPQVAHSNSWTFFAYASFAASVAMILGGILFLPLEIWVKGYFLMAVVALIQSCITLTKTIRDSHEAGRLLNRIEDAKTEQLLMKIDRS
jgi:hypothetical protein